MLPRTPAAGLACLHIKIQISGGCLNGATKERSEFRRTGRLQGSPFLSPISFGDAKEMGSAVGPRPDSLPESKHTASTRSRLAPIPAFPQWGKEFDAPHPNPLPQAGEGVQGAALVLPRTPAARLACFHIKIQISGGCLNGATQERSEFRRTSRLQGSPFLSPISFGDAKEMGSAVGPRPDSLPQTKHTAKPAHQATAKKRTFQTAEQLTQN